MTHIDARALEKMIGISLSEDEALALQKQLTSIFAYVEKITEFTCKGPDVFADTQNSEVIVHEDTLRECTYAQEILEGAPTKERTYIAVPKYIGDQV